MNGPGRECVLLIRARRITTIIVPIINIIIIVIIITIDHHNKILIKEEGLSRTMMDPPEGTMALTPKE
jgi:hypothetical protein